MSHFIGAVIIPAQIPTDVETVTRDLGFTSYEHVEGNPTLEAILEQLLEPFSEQIEVPRYLRETKAEAIAEQRARDQRVKETTYAEYLADPALYATKNFHNPKHVEWLRNDFPKEIELDDEGVWARLTEYYEAETDYTEEGFFSTYNPQSKWDWYTIGGRWQDQYEKRQGESVEALRAALRTQLLALEQPIPDEQLTQMDRLFGHTTELVLPEGVEGELLSIPRSIVIPQPDGTVAWFEKGAMGYFGMSFGDIEAHEWAANALKALEVVTGEANVVYIDFHI